MCSFIESLLFDFKLLHILVYTHTFFGQKFKGAWKIFTEGRGGQNRNISRGEGGQIRKNLRGGS